MRGLWYRIYNVLGVPFLWLFFNIYGVINSKVKEGLKDRRDLFGMLNRSLSVLKNKKNVLIHSSSLGEYQQALPLVEELSKKNYNVFLSFFSPSGYNNSRITFHNAVKTYIPLDSVSKQKKFLDLINPEIIIFIRYDLWFNLLFEAKKRNIKTVLANARFDENDSTWRIPVISSFKKALYGMIETIFVIDDYDETNYKKILKGEDVKIIKVGDSKFERVYQSAGKIKEIEILPEKIIAGKKIFVMGSSWKDDEEVVLPAVDKSLEFDKDLLTILVPHEPKESKILALERSIENNYKNIQSVRYSDLENYNDQNLIILDMIGLLSKIYSLAYISYVGGGFKTGLHNILEPAIFNMPILFSNEIKNSDEDEILIKSGCGIVISDTKQFYRIFRKFLNDKSHRDATGDKCRLVFQGSIGIAEKIVNIITKN
ncbi:MAG: glycosyltransferase N-terminal domain-containing protein [Ignavibacteria bacterium]